MESNAVKPYATPFVTPQSDLPGGKLAAGAQTLASTGRGALTLWARDAFVGILLKDQRPPRGAAPARGGDYRRHPRPKATCRDRSADGRP